MPKETSLSKSAMRILRFSRRLWVRVSLMAGLGLIAPGIAALVAPFIPQEFNDRFKPEAVMPILTILASGMLAVSTFSLNVMVSAHRAAAAQATPRAHRILMADTTTQSVLATFIGSFVYALSAIIMFQSRLNQPGTSFIMLGVTVLVVVLVIIAMLRWIDHLSDLGSMDATLRATVAEARPPLLQTRLMPALGGSLLTKDLVLPTDAQPVKAPRTGYVQFIDLPSIDAGMTGEAASLYLTTVPGEFVLRGQIIGHTAGLSADEASKLTQHLIIGDLRTFEQDGAYGLLVLSEIAIRALSPGINDPGTAIEVIAHQQGLLWEWANTPRNEDTPLHPRIFLQELSAYSLVENAYAGIARDGAEKSEVIECLKNALETLAGGPDHRLAKGAEEMSSGALFKRHVN